MPYSDPVSAEVAFYDAFRKLDLEQMTGVWMESANASCIHPGGGLLQGTATILASWAEIFRDAQPPQVSHRLIQASTDERLAVHTVQEEVSSAGGRRAVILATNIYAYLDGGWRMLAHHASLPLVESDSVTAAQRPPLH